MSETRVGLRIATGLAVLAGAAGLSACGSDTAKYSRHTEAALQRIISPEMRRIARTAIRLEQTTTGKINEVAVVSQKHGATEIFGTTLKDGNMDTIDVSMRDYPGTKKPNPSDVLVAYIEDDINPSNNAPKGGYFDDDEIEYIAPGQSNPYNKISEGLTNLYGFDSHGWTGIESDVNGTNGQVSDLSGAIDTADSQYFAVDDNFNPTNPITTAKDIASDTPDTLAVVVDSFDS